MKISQGMRALLAVAFFCSSASHAVETAPSFSFSDGSATVALKDLKDQVVYLDFWASWCGPCRKSMPWMNKMQEKYKDQGLVIIGVNVDSDRKAAEDFLKAVPANFKVVYDPEGKIAAQYKLMGMPNSFLIARDGTMQKRHVGFKEGLEDEYETEIRQLLKQ
ncbi:MAG: TlpA disulfide reductase family protein [Pseudomonadota bacterium]